MSGFQGLYAFNGSDTMAFAVIAGEAWCRFMGQGLLRTVPVDTIGAVVSPATGAQAVFENNPFGLPMRLIQYVGRKRFIFERVSESVPSEVLARIASAARFSRTGPAPGVLAAAPGKYDFGSDSLKVAATSGDSLAVRIPGYQPLIFHPAGDSLFRCPWGELSLAFRGCAGGSCRSAVFGNGASEKVVPVSGDVPSNTLKAAPAADSGRTWSSGNGGTGRDSFIGIKGQGRYACSGDGLFLKPGDGILESAARAVQEDPISLREGGDALTFRIPGMAGKRAALELRACADKDSKGKRIRVSVWGGAHPDSLRRLEGREGWLPIGASGSYWTLDSLPVESDPWYVRLREEDTPDAPFANAFDGYRLGEVP
jgi:hypothetical protein